jgi:hypothetical protein
VLYFAELPAWEGTIPAAILSTYSPLIQDLHLHSSEALEACLPCNSNHVEVMPLTSITSVVAMYDLPNGPPGAFFAGEKIGFESEYIPDLLVPDS